MDITDFLPGTEELRKIVTEKPESWDVAWQKNVTPWDAGDIQPPLKHVIESGVISLPKQGRALVPGCGRGYDTVYLASRLGYDVIGLDISTTAMDAANELLQSKSTGSDVDLTSKVQFQTDDFFTLTVPPEERFDLIYDYTFFVAIPPSKRPSWAEQMRTLIKPGGFLITLMFPLMPRSYEGGPPFYSNHQHYVDVLGKEWEVVFDQVPDDESLDDRHKGKDRIVVWRRVGGS